MTEQKDKGEHETLGKSDYSSTTPEEVVERLSNIQSVRITETYNTDRTRVEPVLLRYNKQWNTANLNPLDIGLCYNSEVGYSYTDRVRNGTIISLQPVKTPFHRKLLVLAGVTENPKKVEGDLIDLLEREIGLLPFDRETVEQYKTNDNPYTPLPYLRYLEKIGEIESKLSLSQEDVKKERWDFSDIMPEGHLVKPITVRLRL